MDIRILTEHDAILFQSLRLRGLQETPDAFAITAQEFQQESLNQIASRLRPVGDPPERFVLGAFDAALENNLTGIVGFIREQPRKLQHRGFIWGMYVTPEVRHQGIGTRLLQDLLQRARAIDGLEQVHLTVVANNVAAQQLYLSLGFRVYGLEPHAFKRNDTYLDEELMVLPLTASAQAAG